MNLTTKQSLVYVIQAQGTSLCKLGVTTDLASRLRSIQTGCPHKCVVLATWPGSTRLEAKLHKHFAGYRRAGEWFELPAFCGRQIWDIVKSHDTAGLVAARKRGASEKVVGSNSRPKKWSKGQSHGVAVPPKAFLQESGAGWSVMRYVAFYKDGKPRKRRFYIGYLSAEQYVGVRKLPHDAQREFISAMIASREAKLEQSAPAA